MNLVRCGGRLADLSIPGRERAVKLGDIRGRDAGLIHCAAGGTAAGVGREIQAQGVVSACTLQLRAVLIVQAVGVRTKASASMKAVNCEESWVFMEDSSTRIVLSKTMSG